MCETALHIKPRVKTNETRKRCPCVRFPDPFDSLPLFPDLCTQRAQHIGWEWSMYVFSIYQETHKAHRSIGTLKTGHGLRHLLSQRQEDQKLKVIISYLREFEASWGHLGLCLKQTKPKPKQNSQKGERQERQEGGPSHNAKHNAGAFCLRVLFIFPTALCGKWAYSHFTSRVWEDTCNLLSTQSHKAVGGARLTEALLCPQCSWSPWFTEGACVIPICILQAANAGC